MTEIESNENGDTIKEEESDSENEENGGTMEVNAAENDVDDDFEKRYNMDAYDDGDDDNTLSLANLMSHANPRDDQYLVNPDMDDDQSDIEDSNIKPTDNLLLVGHVEGNASILEVYGRILCLKAGLRSS